MRPRLLSLSALSVMALGLWVMPSVGTQGQGTLGDSFVHADKAVFKSDPQSRSVLGAGDAIVARAINRL